MLLDEFGREIPPTPNFAIDMLEYLHFPAEFVEMVAKEEALMESIAGLGLYGADGEKLKPKPSLVSSKPFRTPLL